MVTPLLPDNWEAVLRRHGLLEEFKDVPPGLRRGFRIGANGPVLSTYTPPNHSSALDRPEAIREHINSELSAGRYSGPFSKDSLERLIGPFQTAPLGVVEKASSPGKFRIIQDFSFPRNSSTSRSLNSQIDPNDFPCTWGFYADVAAAVSAASPGTEAAIFDVDAAYRRIPVDIDDQPHTVVMWGDEFYVDHAVPFGAASSNGLFAHCGDALAIIYARQGPGLVFKWVDDFLFIRPPSTSTTPSSADHKDQITEDSIYELAEFLGWPWKKSKTKNFSPQFPYLGFVWDLDNKTVEIPAEKRTKYLTRLSQWSQQGTVNLRDTQAILGTLIHCALAIPEGKPHLSGLISFGATFSSDYADRFTRRAISCRARDDVQWWIDRLTRGPFGSSLRSPPAPLNIRVHSDASTSFGIGVVIGDEWCAWKLLHGWRTEGRGIGWAEAVGVELALERLITTGVRDTSVTFHCDNQGVVLAWKAGRSRSEPQNQVIARIAARAAEHDIWVNLQYVNTKENVADSPSRGLPPSFPSHKPLTFPTPLHLRVLLEPSINHF